MSQRPRRRSQGERRRQEGPQDEVEAEDLDQVGDHEHEASASAWPPSSPTPATCVHCGRSVPSLYRLYSNKASVLKVMSCAHCGHTADKYIEYDPVIVLLDLVLLNKEAFRHILYNTVFDNHWKLAVLMVLIEGYVVYDSLGPGQDRGRAWDDLAMDLDAHPPVLHGERLFYMVCAESLVASTAFFGTVMFLSWGLRPPGLTALLLWKALVLGSFAIFLSIPALIWQEPGGGGGRGRQWVDAAFIGGYTFLALLQVHSVVCRCGRALSALVVALGLAAKLGCRELLRGMQLQLSLPFE